MSVPVPTERLDEIEARVAAGTRRPWSLERISDGESVSWQIPDVLRDRYGTNAITSDDQATVFLIAHAPDDLTDLVAEVRALRARLGAVEGLRRQYQDRARATSFRRYSSLDEAAEVARQAKALADVGELIEAALSTGTGTVETA